MKNILLHSLFLFSVLICSSQTKTELQKQQNKLKKEMQQINKLLFNEEKREKNILEELSYLNKKIQVRNDLISVINAESKLLQKEVLKNEKKINYLTKKLNDLKSNYGDMIYKSYKSKSQQSRLMFVLSSKNFYQAYKRIAYMKQYANFRKKQGDEIIAQTKIAENLKDSLLLLKKEKDILVTKQKKEKYQIELDQKEKEVLIASIKEKGRSYKRQLQKKLKEERKITAKIDKIIREEIAKANKNSKNKKEFILSPEAKNLASNFERNKGKLPWPIKEGIITRRFGPQKHPIYPGITVNGTGLHFTTSKESVASSIFNGKVMNILINAEGIKNVLVKHGNYISSYNNLETVYVSKGQEVQTGQALGKIFTNKISKKTKLIFVLYKNTIKLNPESWILKR